MPGCCGEGGGTDSSCWGDGGSGWRGGALTLVNLEYKHMEMRIQGGLEDGGQLIELGVHEKE